MSKTTGWLLDLYEDEETLSLWIITENEERLQFHIPFPMSFYAAGPSSRLRTLWRWLDSRPEKPLLSRQEKRDLFLPEPIPVLRAQTACPALHRSLFQDTQRFFPDLTYYNADLEVHIRFAARLGAFPLARLQLEANSTQTICALQVLDSPWDIDPPQPALRVMELNLDCNPSHRPPSLLTVLYQGNAYRIPLVQAKAVVFWLKHLLQKYDPDILVSDFGDTWLLDYLFKAVEQSAAALPLSRDSQRSFARRAARSYFSYGQIFYRGQQILLFGRLHIDRNNSMGWNDNGLDGIFETARLTALPIQSAARVSPGTGISCMQMITALRNGILVPWHKQQAEKTKTALDLLHADMGGLVYQPIVGLHSDVAEIDFISLYPSVMVRCDISPEKQPRKLSDPPPTNPGLIPLTLEPLLNKRMALKECLKKIPTWDPRSRVFKAQAAAQKWLLVVCFGYLGYRNARFGRIEAHEAVTAGGREALLLAKETAEDLGFEVLHLFVDGLWIKQAQYRQTQDFQTLLGKIEKRTGLHISLNGIYRWVVFCSSRQDERVPVGNRYFGVFQDGSIKVRGLESRRKDTPPWITQTQMALIQYLAQAENADDLTGYFPGALQLLKKATVQLKEDGISLQDLLVSQKMSRKIEDYRTPSPAARASQQLQTIGKHIAPGERVQFLLTLGEPGVYAWGLPQTFDSRTLDKAAYRKLLLRATENVLVPIGVERAHIHAVLCGGAIPLHLF